MLKISNKQMRHIWLDAMGLSKAPTGVLDLTQVIKDLGFVQLDTIQNVMRAHHHILWSRNQNFREIMLDNLLAERQDIFEHFTHDASILPTDFYPMWQRQFKQFEQKFKTKTWFKGMSNAAERMQIEQRINEEGPLCTSNFDTKIKGEKKMWSRPPHKLALDYMWYIGELSTSHRVGFRKFYDLTHKVIPEHILDNNLSDDAQIEWLCNAALTRLSIANAKQIKEFWEAVKIPEVKNWVKNTDLLPVKWQMDDGDYQEAFMLPSFANKLEDIPKPVNRLRILNPFDPAIRDRNRLKAIFGIDYKIEIFVPAHKRKWGYYVYLLLEGDKFVGRIELKADRKKGDLLVSQFWQEEGVKWGDARFEKLNTELRRFAAFAGLENIVWFNKTSL